jgi:RNA polymerase sigma-70 factor (ECF subfamily)
VDPRTLEGLFRRYSRTVFRRARAILGDGDAAKDVVQEVFLRAMSTTHGRGEADGGDLPLAWLYRVTTNLCLKRLRDTGRRRRLLDRFLPRLESGALPAVDEALTVRALLRNVPEPLQEIAVYYFVDHMSQDEIAALVGLPRRTVGYRLEQFRTRVFAVVPRPELAS